MNGEGQAGYPVQVQIENLRGRIAIVEADHKSHETICAERYEGICNSIKTLNGRISWAAAIVVSTLLAVLGWSLSAQYEQAQQTQRALVAIAQGAKPGSPGATVADLPTYSAPQSSPPPAN